MVLTVKYILFVNIHFGKYEFNGFLNSTKHAYNMISKIDD